MERWRERVTELVLIEAYTDHHGKKKYYYKALTLYNAQRIVFERSLYIVHHSLNRSRILPIVLINDCLTRTRCIRLVAVSDVFRDECGTIYRAYAVNQYITPESMHHLVSRGRSIQKLAGSQFREYEAGKIWTVPASSFPSCRSSRIERFKSNFGSVLHFK